MAEIEREPKVKTESSSKKTAKEKCNSGELASVVLPARWTIEYAAPEYFSDLGVPLIKAIAQRHSPSLFKQISPLGDDDLKTLEEIFKSKEMSEEIAFWEDFSRMVAFKETNGVTSARSLGVSFNAGEEEDHYFARIYSEHPDIVFKILSSSVAQNSETSVARNFHVFQGSQLPTFITPKIAQLHRGVLEEILKIRFFDAKYGTHCEVTLLKSESLFGFSVNRAGTLSRPSKVNGKTDKPDYDTQRSRKTDVLLYLPATNTLWIKTANKGDIEIYRAALEEALGVGSIFSVRRTLDLPQIFRRDLGSLFQNHMTALGYDKLELRSYKFKDHEGVERKIKVDRSEPCRTVRLASSADTQAGNTLLEAKLRFRRVDEKQYITVDVKAETVRISAGVEIDEIDALLTVLKLWIPYGNN